MTSTPKTDRGARIGVMGGTFDPIHHGHLVVASEVASRFCLDEVIFVPTGRPPHKKEVSDPWHRYLMAVIATASNQRFSVSKIDIERTGPTFTVDTLRELREQLPSSDLFFITGTDALARIFSWKDADTLWSLAHFVAVSRPWHEVVDIPNDRISFLEVPAMAISSSNCRERVRSGLPIWYLVPEGVVQYIAKHGLYRSLYG